MSGSFCQISPAIALQLASDDMKMGSFTMRGDSEIDSATASLRSSRACRPCVSHLMYFFVLYSCSILCRGRVISANLGIVFS